MTFLKQNTFYEKEEFIQETSPSIQNNFSTSSWIDVNNSAMQYTPSCFSSYVCYEFAVFYSKDSQDSNISNIRFKLQYSDDNGSSWADWGENTDVYIGSDSTNLRRADICRVKFFLETTASGSRIAWKSNRNLKLLGKKTNGDVRLNQLNEFYDSSGENSNTPHYYYPTTKCFSIKG